MGGAGEENKHKMMQNLFGEQSEEEEEEVDSEHESNPHPNYASDEAEGGLPPDDDDARRQQSDFADVDVEEGQGDVEMMENDDDDLRGGVAERGEESEADRDDENSQHQHGVTSRRQEVVESASEEDAGSHHSDSPVEKKNEAADEIRDVFGDSDEDEEDGGGYAVGNDRDKDSAEQEGEEEEEEEEEEARPDNMVPGEDAYYESEEERVTRQKEKPVGPPIELEIPLRPPPAEPTKMNMIKVSNIMGIDLKKFDPKTYKEEETLVTDESGSTKRIRLQNNIVRYREVKTQDGGMTYESNARFVRWSDGSLQLLIGNEVLDISVQDARHDHSHLFLRHDKGILQSQGRISSKMRFMPSSLSSNSHRLLTALVDSRHKKVYKVKNCVTQIDPEREKEDKERAESQNIRNNVLLNKKKEKVNRKYMQAPDKRRQLSTDFLEDALEEEDDDEGYYDSRRRSHRYEEDLEAEAQAERRIMNAKKSHGVRDIPRKSSMKPARRPVNRSESEREESEYETDGEEYERPKRVEEDSEPEYEDDEEDEEADINEEEVTEGARHKGKGKESRGSHKRKEIESDEESPPRKAPAHRRMAVVYDSDDE
ncbi:hypothetical protein ACFE04_011023 [Oxalis oulophora]